MRRLYRDFLFADGPDSELTGERPAAAASFAAASWLALSASGLESWKPRRVEDGAFSFVCLVSLFVSDFDRLSFDFPADAPVFFDDDADGFPSASDFVVVFFVVDRAVFSSDEAGFFFEVFLTPEPVLLSELFFAPDFFDPDFFDGDFFEGDFFEGDFFDAGFFDAVFFEGDFLTVAFFLVTVFFFAVFFRLEETFFDPDFFAVFFFFDTFLEVEAFFFAVVFFFDERAPEVFFATETLPLIILASTPTESMPRPEGFTSPWRQ